MTFTQYGTSSFELLTSVLRPTQPPVPSGTGSEWQRILVWAGPSLTALIVVSGMVYFVA